MTVMRAGDAITQPKELIRARRPRPRRRANRPLSPRRRPAPRANKNGPPLQKGAQGSLEQLAGAASSEATPPGALAAEQAAIPAKKTGRPGQTAGPSVKADTPKAGAVQAPQKRRSRGRRHSLDSPPSSAFSCSPAPRSPSPPSHRCSPLSNRGDPANTVSFSSILHAYLHGHMLFDIFCSKPP